MILSGHDYRDTQFFGNAFDPMVIRRNQNLIKLQTLSGSVINMPDHRLAANISKRFAGKSCGCETRWNDAVTF